MGGLFSCYLLSNLSIIKLNFLPLSKSILKYIVNPKDPNNQISNSTKEVLKFANLMKSYNDGSSNNEADNDSVVLTASAFQFLLLNRKVQIWYFIIKLLDYFLEVS